MGFDNKNIELNYIWVGGNKMPPHQMKILHAIIATNQDVAINIWVDNKATYEILVSQLVNSKVKTIPYNLKNVKYLTIDKLKLDIPEEIILLIESTKEAKQWAALSDLYRLLIITRPEVKNERYVRFYVEADNIMQRTLWKKLQANDVGAFYRSSFEGRKLFGPGQTRGDLIFVNLATENGKHFANKVRDHMLVYLCDPIINLCFTKLLENAKSQGGLNEHDVLASYGMLIQSVFRLHYMTISPKDMHGMGSVLIDLKDLARDYSVGDGNVRRSWLDPNKDYLPIDQGVLFEVFLYRMSDISDVSGILPEQFLKQGGYSSREDFITKSEEKLLLQYKGELPNWFKEFISLDAELKATNYSKPVPKSRP